MARLLGEDRPLALDDRRVELFGADGQRAGGRDVHGDLAAEAGELGLLAARLDADQHAELAETVGDGIVDIGRRRRRA